jgi:hypothetical protein
MGVVSHRRGSDPPFIGALRQLRDPLLLFAFTAASWLCMVADAVVGSMLAIGVRGLRCVVLAVTSPAHGARSLVRQPHRFRPLVRCVTWRDRDTARLAGLAISSAVAAKLGPEHSLWRVR